MSYYTVYPTEHVAAAMAQPGCVTTDPRHSLDGSLAILEFPEPGEGSLTHEQALALVATDVWSDNTGLPQ